MSEFALDSLDLAALLCSRVCHDVISPVGAIVNGLEVLEDEQDAEMRSFALELIKKSARTASARLQFCRLAFGAAGSAGAAIDTGDAEQVARGLLCDERTKLEWHATRVLMPKNKVKLALKSLPYRRGGDPARRRHPRNRHRRRRGNGAHRRSERHQCPGRRPCPGFARRKTGYRLRRCARHPGLLYRPRRPRLRDEARADKLARGDAHRRRAGRGAGGAGADPRLKASRFKAP